MDKAGISKGFGFVTMGSARAAQIAMQAAAGMVVEGRTINVVYSHKTTMERSEICSKYKKGECTRGDNCRYIHEGPIDLPFKSTEPRNERIRSDVCRDFKIGKCIHGNNCRYIHESDEGNREGSGGGAAGGGLSEEWKRDRDPPNGRYSRSVRREFRGGANSERSRSRE